jgi:hypothetical protein
MTPVPTKLQVASIASILLIVAFAAPIIAVGAVGAVEDGCTIGLCGIIALVLLIASFAILFFLRKLGLQNSRYHAICQWTCVSSWGVFAALQVMQSYQQSDYLSVVYWGSLSYIFAMYSYKTFVVAARSSSFHLKNNIQDQELIFDIPNSAAILIVFAFAIFLLIPFAIAAFTYDNIAVATLGAVESIVLAMLAVSSWIVATTPMVAHDESETLVPQEDTAETSNNDGDMA